MSPTWKLLAILVASVGCGRPVREHVTADGIVVVGANDSKYSKAILREDYEEAEALSQESVNVRPDSFRLWIELAHAQLLLGKYSDARVSYEMAVDLAPNSTIAIYGLGLVAQRQGDFGTAKRHYERSLEIDDGFPEGHFGMAAACEGLRLNDLVVKHAMRFLEISPGSAMRSEAQDMIDAASSAK